MGNALNGLRKKVADDDAVLVTVITDGYENASCEYDGKAIKGLVESLKKKGWVFTYIGANQDVEAVAAAMSITNTLSFSADAQGTSAMFAREQLRMNYIDGNGMLSRSSFRLHEKSLQGGSGGHQPSCWPWTTCWK